MRLGLKITPSELSGKAGDVFLAQAILENQGDSEIAIEWTSDPNQYLELRVTDNSGKDISAFPFASLFSPVSPTARVLRLAPKQTYSSKINVFANVKTEDLRPGIFHIQAVYQYRGATARANAVEVSIR